ncbi:MAG TPA: nuclear transport factor 2 family protein, partial [Acidimicrobiales bacterium]
LKAGYAALVDARFARGAVVDRATLGDLARRAAGLFCEDGEWDGGPGLGVARGREEIAARLAAPSIVFSRHFFVTPRIAVEGDRATGRWELLSPCTRPDGTSLWMVGAEDDAYRRVDGVWLHESMALTTYFVSPAGEGWPRILA